MKEICSLCIYVLGKQDKRQKAIQPNAYLSFRITNPQVSNLNVLTTAKSSLDGHLRDFFKSPTLRRYPRYRGSFPAKFDRSVFRQMPT